MIDTVDLDGLEVLFSQHEERARKRALDHLPPLADPGALALVARLLGDPSGAVCEAAVNVLARSSAPATALAIAIAHLGAAEAPERRHACTVLVRCGADAVPSIVDMLHNSDPHMRKYAVDILAEIGDPAGAQALIGALDDENMNVAAAAAEALGRLQAAEAVPALAAALARHSDWLSIAVLGALGEIGGAQAFTAACRASRKSAGPVLAAAMAAVGRTGAAGPRRALCALASSVGGSGGRHLMNVAVVAMAEILRRSSAWPPLVPGQRTALMDVLHHSLLSAQPDVRAAAVYCLGLAGELEPVRAALDTIDSSPTGLAALRVLALSNSFEQCDEAIFRHFAIDAPDSGMQAIALRALLVHGAAGAPALAASLCANHEFTDDEEALETLCDCNAEHLVRVALYALNDAQPETGRSVFRALFPVERAGDLNRSSSGKQLLRMAAAQDDWPTRAHAMTLLGAARARWARTILRSACDDAEERVRVRAIRSLAQCGLQVRDAEHIKTHLVDASGWVRAAAVDALTRGNWLAEDETALMSALCDDFLPVALAAARATLALAEQGAPSVTDAVRGQLGRVAVAEFVQSDPAMALWRTDKGEE